MVFFFSVLSKLPVGYKGEGQFYQFYGFIDHILHIFYLFSFETCSISSDFKIGTHSKKDETILV